MLPILWQVHLGEGVDEYRVPQEFYRRTYLTETLRRLLSGAIRRLTGTGGDPVVQWQTNLRRRQNTYDVGPLSPVFWRCPERTCRHGRDNERSRSNNIT